MSKPLRVLIVEDSEDDALLIIRELKRGGYDVTFERVETAEAMAAALKKQVWDVIISDYSMPHFSIPEALKLFQQSGLDLPFIVVSGTIGEETAVATMKAGAHDYLMKDNLKRLTPAIARELYEAKVRKGRKEAEESIKKAAEEWRTTFDSIADIVSIHDKDFRLVRVNKAFADLAKKKPKELIGKHCYEIFHGTNEPVLLCPHKKTIKTKKSATAEYFEPYLGIHLEVMTSPIFDEKGEVTASVRVARDITERKKMEEQLVVTDRLASIGELSSGIAHELNNPLTGIIGLSELVLEKELPDDIKEDIAVINREAQRTAEIVSNLLTFARKHPKGKQAVDINDIIQQVLKIRAYEQKVSNIEVNTQFDAELPEVMANGLELQQVFINIVINAEHFMLEAHGRGTLTITTERVKNMVRASFADDGPGIPEENLGHLFDPFFTTKEVGKGTGLGLSISYGIITEHGGRIYAKSKSGKGATFVVELPISKQG